jgi:Protein of unknown function (DUF3775)
MPKISAAKVAHAIARAREHDIVAGSWERLMQRAFLDEPGHQTTDSFNSSIAGGVLAEYVDTLDQDEQASLLAIAWIGRGMFPPENFAEAFEKAKSEHLFVDASNLIGIPLLADYLYEGVEKLGFPLG